MRYNNSLKKKINHIAIIMDGNGRWARKHNCSKKKGHEAGINNCINICKNLKNIDFSINELSFYVFSTENWNRNSLEIHNLFNLIEKFYINFKETAEMYNLVVRHCGSRKKLSKKILKIIDSVTTSTKKNSGTNINLMFNYGSRQEITDAMSLMIKTKKKKANIRNFFYLPKSSDPDLIIRTGGEQRLSNFMLWQSAYAELYFTKILWPDFKALNLNNAIIKYFERNRKYGK